MCVVCSVGAAPCRRCRSDFLSASRMYDTGLFLRLRSAQIRGRAVVDATEVYQGLHADCTIRQQTAFPLESFYLSNQRVIEQGLRRGCFGIALYEGELLSEPEHCRTGFAGPDSLLRERRQTPEHRI